MGSATRRSEQPLARPPGTASVKNLPVPPALPAEPVELTGLLTACGLPYLRRAAPEVRATARAQRNIVVRPQVPVVRGDR